MIEPPQVAYVVPTFGKLMDGFRFKQGDTYGEFRQGDRVAEYGLTALITGGATAVAAKTGMLKWLWKAIVAALVAIGAAIKGLFGRKKATAK